MTTKLVRITQPSEETKGTLRHCSDPDWILKMHCSAVQKCSAHDLEERSISTQVEVSIFGKRRHGYGGAALLRYPALSEELEYWPSWLRRLPTRVNKNFKFLWNCRIAIWEEQQDGTVPPDKPDHNTGNTCCEKLLCAGVHRTSKNDIADAYCTYQIHCDMLCCRPTAPDPSVSRPIVSRQTPISPWHSTAQPR